MIRLAKILTRLRSGLFCLLLMGSGQIGAAVMVKSKMWPQHSQLRVLFLDGSPSQHAAVTDIAPDWLNETNLKFVFFNDPAKAPAHTHIRVSFRSHSGSMLGNHQDYQSRKPTLVLSDLNQLPLDSKAARRLILHEFGHALGLEHEFLSPEWPYDDKPLEAVRLNCQQQMRQIGESEEDAATDCKRLNHALPAESVQYTLYDEYSIMNYPLHIDEYGHSQFKPAATRLSIMDHYAMQNWYPKDCVMRK